MATSTSATTARTKFEALLPPSYDPPIKQEGRVNAATYDARVTESTPRYRGNNMLIDVASRLIGRGPEAFTKQQRTAQIGKFAVEGWSAGDEHRARLDIRDTVYTPINPVGGNISPIRSLEARYLHTASRDADGFEKQTGVTFNFLDLRYGSDSTAIHSSVGYHTQEAPGVSSEYAIAEVKDFLGNHGFGTSYQELNHRIVDLAGLCIKLSSSA